jgi:hypothetical protein
MWINDGGYRFGCLCDCLGNFKKNLPKDLKSDTLLVGKFW